MSLSAKQTVIGVLGFLFLLSLVFVLLTYSAIILTSWWHFLGRKGEICASSTSTAAGSREARED